MLQGCVGTQCCVIGLNHSCGNLNLRRKKN
jgi:hypothetical protein